MAASLPGDWEARWEALDRDGTDVLPHCRARSRIRRDAAATGTACILLHGFNSAPGELFDQAVKLADALGAHLLAPRLPGHGSETPTAMRGITAASWIGRVDAAYSLARSIANEIVLIGSSLGGSLALELASRREVAALVLWSPGIRPVESSLLDRFCAAGDEVLVDERERSAYQDRWNRRALHADAFRALRDVFAKYMHAEVFAQVTAPIWLGYYFKSNAEQDPSSRVEEMLRMFEQLGTLAERKIACAFTEAAHNLASPEKSPSAQLVIEESQRFVLNELRGELRLPGRTDSDS